MRTPDTPPIGRKHTGRTGSRQRVSIGEKNGRKDDSPVIGRTAILAVGALALAVGEAAPGAQDQQPRSQPGWPCVGRPDPAYFRIAEATGGQVFLFDKSEIGNSAILAIMASRYDETVFRMAGSLVDGRYEFSFPIESAVEGVMISVSLQCLQSSDIVTPSGQLLQNTAPGDFHVFHAGRIVTLPQPEPGIWRVRVSGHGMFSLVVQAKSELSLDRVRFVREGGRPGHEGLFPTHEPPRAAVPQWIAIEVTGSLSDVRARLVTSAFENLATLHLRESSGAIEPGALEHEFLAQVTPPATPFRVVVSGFDAAGLPFQRVHAPLFEPARR